MNASKNDNEGHYIRIADVTRLYGQVRALSNVSIDIAKHEFVAILGPSGSGKSTLLRLIAGLDRPTEGRIYFDGQDVTDMPPHRRGIGMVFQEFLLFPHRTVRENLTFPLRMTSQPQQKILERLDWAEDVLSLRGLMDRYPNQLSGGQQQRVALGRGLVTHPTLLLLDEPLANLDRELRNEMEVEIRRYQKQLGIPFVYVTHNQEEALSMSDRVAVINGGKLEALGERQDIYDHPPTPFVARFVGKSTRFEGVFNPATQQVELRRYEYSFPFVNGVERKGSAQVEVFVKNERFQLSPWTTEAPGIQCAVADIVLRGPFVEYIVETQSGDRLIAVKPKTGDPMPLGTKLALTWDPSQCHIFPVER